MSRGERGRISSEPHSDREFSLLVGRVAGVLGVLLALAGALMADISLEVLGIMCGLFAYALGARRLGVVAATISALVLVLSLTVMRDYSPGIELSHLGSSNLPELSDPLSSPW